jgi:hypothetical protein
MLPHRRRYDDVAASLPDAHTRWRCAACGNLTRFDVTLTRRTTEFWHFDLAGAHRVEETTTEREDVGSVTCRWCGRDDAIEAIEPVSNAEADSSTP